MVVVGQFQQCGTEWRLGCQVEGDAGESGEPCATMTFPIRGFDGLYRSSFKDDGERLVDDAIRLRLVGHEARAKRLVTSYEDR